MKQENRPYKINWIVDEDQFDINEEKEYREKLDEDPIYFFIRMEIFIFKIVFFAFIVRTIIYLLS